MKFLIKTATSFLIMMMVALTFIGCAKKDNENNVAESLELTTATFGEIEFENGESVSLKQEADVVTVSGVIEKMSESQKMEFGVEDVDYVVVLKFKFDKERTLEQFEIKGEKTKVYSTDDSVENYAGAITDLLDSEGGEDAFTYLILSAHTKNYELKTRYNDQTESVIKLNITATLAESES